MKRTRAKISKDKKAMGKKSIYKRKMKDFDPKFPTSK